MRADGTRQRNLTRSLGVQDYDPDWSPDGSRLAIVSERDGDAEIYTLKTDRLARAAAHLQRRTVRVRRRPDWSPDGREDRLHQ